MYFLGEIYCLQMTNAVSKERKRISSLCSKYLT